MHMNNNGAAIASALRLLNKGWSVRNTSAMTKLSMDEVWQLQRRLLRESKKVQEQRDIDRLWKETTGLAAATLYNKIPDTEPTPEVLANAGPVRYDRVIELARQELARNGREKLR